MDIRKLVGQIIDMQVGWVEFILGDFSDADMLTRPCPGANHAAWQLGHVIASDNRMVAAAGFSIEALPAGFAEKFTTETAKLDSPAAFPRKADLLDVFKRQAASKVAWVAKLSDADLAKAMPQNLHAFAPTVAHLVANMPNHLMMHVGQMQVVRRALGKPVLM